MTDYISVLSHNDVLCGHTGLLLYFTYMFRASMMFMCISAGDAEEFCEPGDLYIRHSVSVWGHCITTATYRDQRSGDEGMGTLCIT